MKAQDYLETAREPFDIIFLDPPFQKELLAPLCSRIAEKKLLKEKGFIYIEAEKDLTLDLPSSWEILKHKTTQHTQYMLAQHKD